MSWNVDNKPIRLSFTGEEQWLGLCKNFEDCGAYLVRQKDLWSRKVKRPVCHNCKMERVKLAQRERYLKQKGGSSYKKMMELRKKLAQQRRSMKKKRSPEQVRYDREYLEIVDMKKRGLLSDEEHAYELDLLQRKYGLSTPQVA